MPQLDELIVHSVNADLRRVIKLCVHIKLAILCVALNHVMSDILTHQVLKVLFIAFKNVFHNFKSFPKSLVFNLKPKYLPLLVLLLGFQLFDCVSKLSVCLEQLSHCVDRMN
jgi:hypothetical protein